MGSPANPTGTQVPPRELERIAAFIAERGGVLIADEITRTRVRLRLRAARRAKP
jgi:aspartate/methionine/tyrosine aminotransferase